MTSNEGSGRMRGGAATRMASRRTAMIYWYVIVAGALGLTVVAAIFGPGIWSRVGDNGKVAAWVVFALALVYLLVSRVLASRIKPRGATVENIAVTRSVVATAFNGSVALLAPLAWMVSGKMVALVALAISLVGLLLVMPSQRRWQKLSRGIEVTVGQELAAASNESRPQPPLSRKVVAMALLGLMALGSVALLVVSGNFIWNEVLLRRPSSPIVRALLFLILALMMTGFAVVRLVRASASRRPRWQRAYGVLLLVFAAYLLVRLVRMV